MIGQQISVVGARTATLATVDPTTLPMPRTRGRALVGLANAVATGVLCLDRAAEPERDVVRRGLLALPGIGPWTSDYIAMRVLSEVDAFLPSDLGVRQAIVGVGHDPAAVLARTDVWSPWRSYALMHLWATLMPPTPVATLGGSSP